MAYRLVLTPGDTRPATLSAEVAVGEPHGWVPIASWPVTMPAVDWNDDDIDIAEHVTANGWQTCAGWAVDDAGRWVAAAEPNNWRSVLQQATARRAAQLAAYELADLAWRTVVADTPRQGQTGYVGAIEIAGIAGLTRHRVYQIQGVGKQPGFRPTGTD